MAKRASERLIGEVERLIHLQALPIFGALPPPELALLARHATPRGFAAGAVLARRGERVSSMNVVVDGAVRVERRRGPSRVLGPHEAVGVIGLLARKDDGVEAIAVTETLTLEIAEGTLLDVCDDHFPVLLHLLRSLSQRSLEERRRLGSDAGYDAHEVPAVAATAPRVLDLVDRIFFLRRTMPLGQSSLTALSALARRVTERRAAPGALLWEEGAASDALLLLVSGSVAGIADGGRQRFRFGPGAAVGALDGLAGVPRWFSASAETEVLALRLSVADFIDVLEDHVQAAMELMAVVASDVLEVAERAS
jgi:CRP-like cAMP-binding protein